LDSAGVGRTISENCEIAINEVCCDCIKELLSVQSHFILVLANPSVRCIEEPFVLGKRNHVSQKEKCE
jgi:hypothetical protein